MRGFIFILLTCFISIFTNSYIYGKENQSDLPFSVNETNITIWNGEKYVPVFLKGINLGIAVPGTFPGELKASRNDYRRWISQIRDAGFNAIRTYTLHYPWFYEVLDSFNLANPNAPLFLLQGVWLEEEHPGFDGDLHQLSESFIDEIETNIDCIHGNRIITHRFGKAHGEYTTDVSRWVMGYIIGREVSPQEVLLTDEMNQGITGYQGRYFSIDQTKPTESWFVKKMDHLVTYENDIYNTQRPVSVSSWPTLDPLYHPTELSRMEDTAFIDLSTTDFSGAEAGMFISYHAYPYYPDFISRSPEYVNSYDTYGKNSYLGYLTVLKEHYGQMPLIIAEYGTPSSIGIAHYASSGIHHGGADENKQGLDKLRMLDNIYSSGAGGGIQFAWIDEWFKRTWLTDPLDYQPEWRILWHNIVSAEQNFGLIGFRQASREYQPWEELCSDCFVRSVKAFSDYTYMNIRLNTSGFLGVMDTLWVAIDTYAEELGESVLPDGHVTGNKSEFLMMITNHSCELYVTEAYDQFGKWHGTASDEQMFHSTATNGSPWKLVKLKNNYFDQELQYIGKLEFQRIDHPPSSNDMVILDTFNIDIHLPWTLINFTHPGEMRVIHDDRDIPGYQDTISNGVALTIVHKEELHKTSQRFRWDDWHEVTGIEEYKKASYFIMKENLHDMPGNPVAVRDNYTMSLNEALLVTATNGVLKNDMSLDGADMTAHLVNGSNSGDLILYKDGSFIFQPERGVAGEIDFTYKVIAAGKSSEPVTVSLNIEGLSKGDGFIRLYPNPGNGLFAIESSSVIDYAEVLNLDGRLMLRANIRSKHHSLDLTHFSPGTYIIKIFSGEQSLMRKAVMIR